ncbi:uncharacterized protein N7483_013206 [Penicillium malachiteum]|uniref:uncharacterized protein n=1 Tax=Penicillium malachiteum TaxID=1324776 RepID=UPI0025467537|nr:uncharacterized protein N7483_013206 [Penicillium malachiteum]KAJ5716025.1 hypothetical protein N7483_013206 [Penicillium malachiteum]
MDEGTKKARNRILGQIKVVLSELLRNIGSCTMRIVGDTPNSVLDHEDLLESVRPFVSEVEECIRQHHPDDKTLFIAAKFCLGKHSYFVVDVNNTRYNYETAHECEELTPVYYLRLSRRQPTILRKPPLDATLSKILMVMHYWHGQDPLPLCDNHFDPNFCYPNPRHPENSAQEDLSTWT